MPSRRSVRAWPVKSSSPKVTGLVKSPSVKAQLDAPGKPLTLSSTKLLPQTDPALGGAVEQLTRAVGEAVVAQAAQNGDAHLAVR